MDAGNAASRDNAGRERNGAKFNFANSAQCRLGCRNSDCRRLESSSCLSLFR
jgi:hypothetical protein